MTMTCPRCIVVWKYPGIPSGRSYINGTLPLTTQRLSYICDDIQQSRMHDACEHAIYRNT